MHPAGDRHGCPLTANPPSCSPRRSPRFWPPSSPCSFAAGARVHVALSASAALAAMTAANPPDLALLDVCLPGIETRPAARRRAGRSRHPTLSHSPDRGHRRPGVARSHYGRGHRRSHPARLRALLLANPPRPGFAHPTPGPRARSFARSLHAQRPTRPPHRRL